MPEPNVAEAGALALAEPLVDPWTRLLEGGVGFLRQLEAALPAEADQGGTSGKSTIRRIEARRVADGSTFLAVPMPSREAVAGKIASHPAMKFPPEINLIAVSHYLQALEYQRYSNQVVAMLGGKTPDIQNVAGAAGSLISNAA